MSRSATPPAPEDGSLGAALEPNEVYRVMVNYLRANGWTRQEDVSGWWWKDELSEDATLGGAVEQQFDRDGIDQRLMIPGEPLVFWPVEDAE